MQDTVFSFIDGLTEDVVELQRRLVAIPALGPTNGGQGEKDKAEFLKEYLAGLGFQDIREFQAPDASVECGYRPNLCAVLPGKDTSRTCWIISHTDVVPVGDLGLWDTDPFELVRNGDTIIGRGVEDNHQGLVSSAMCARAFLENDLMPSMNLGLLMVADEETGSTYGLDYVVQEHPEIFNKDDLFLVPDFGEPTSDMVEIAEKSMCWLKVTVNGKQCHASTPYQGKNSLVAAADLIMRVRTLHDRFDARDELFDPPYSTFESTKKEANVENINTLPGRDVFYIDSRVLPCYDIEDVKQAVYDLGAAVAAEHGVTVDFEVVQGEQAAPPTPADSEIVVRVSEAVREVYAVEPRLMGVGGGTVAAFLRRNGYHAVVWSTLNHHAHQPNEAASISFTLNDAKVMARLLMD